MELLTFKQLVEIESPKSTWRITEYGMECLTTDYVIEAAQLHRWDWLFHMAEKEWCNMNDFMRCFFAARHHHFSTIYPSCNEIRNGALDKKPTRKDRMITTSVRFRILFRDNFRCQLCGDSAAEGATLEVDHKHSVSSGGSDAESNLWTLCFACNRGKGALSLP